MASNHLNIYLIKASFTEPDSIIEKNPDNTLAADFRDIGVGRVYYRPSHIHVPGWFDNFFLSDDALDRDDFKNSSTSAVLVIPVLVRTKVRLFAITFGLGRHLLIDSCYVERFGLITALNIMEASGIRHMDKRTMSNNPRHSREQVSRASTITDFGLDIDQDLLQAISGQSSEAAFGNIVTGKDALKVSTDRDIENIVPFLQNCLATYNRKDYQRNFKWVDQLRHIKDQDRIDELDESMLAAINENSEQVWLSVPEIIDWEKVAGFKYSTRKRDQMYDDLDMEVLLQQDELPAAFTIDDLEQHYITCWYAGEDRCEKKWPIYRCLNAEIDIRRKKFFLSEGKWFEIDREFVTQVNAFVDQITAYRLRLPAYDHHDENAYNVAVANQLGGECLDAKNVPYGGGHSKIEFCDIIADPNLLLYVKKYSGSSVLSHLFNQGSIAGELLIGDATFRNKLREHYMPAAYHAAVPANRPDASTYNIIFVVIARAGRRTVRLPFFSKIALRNCARHLQLLGYQVYLNAVPNHKVND